MIRNIIFDWSGTLVDDLPAVWQATNHVLTQAGLTALSLEQFRAEFSLPFIHFYERFTPGVPLAQLEVWFHASFAGAQDSVVELPHAREFLKFCRACQVRTFVLSTVRADYFELQSQATGFREYIDLPYVQIWDKRDKIRELLAENHLDADETLFIGDMQHDIDTARHGGVRSCAVLTGYNRLDQLRASQPDIIVEHLGELRHILETHDGCLESYLRPETQAARQPVVTVGGLIFDRAGQVLMVRTHKWSNLWGIPGGKTKYGETSGDALRREIKEETALDIEDIEFVMVQDCIHSREFYRDAHFVLLNYTCLARPGGVRLNGEAETYRWTSLPEALALPLNEPTRRLLETVVRQRGEVPKP